MEIKPGRNKLTPLEEWPIKFDCFQHYQIQNVFEMDCKKYDFKDQDSRLETILLESKMKIIFKIYKVLITWFSEGEIVKEYMIKWVINGNKSIEMS